MLRLKNLGLLAFCRKRRGTVGLFCVAKKDSMLR